MKKLLVLLLIATLAAFVFVGCDLIPSEGEGEGEGEGEVESVTIAIDGAYEVGGVKYIKGDKKYDVTVTFPAPVENVESFLTECLGDQSKAIYYEDISIVILVPNEDKTVWSGSMKLTPENSDELCCAVKLVVEAGECDWCQYSETIVVDSGAPYAKLEIGISGGYNVCPCDGCAITGTSLIEESACDPDVVCCGDNCSGLAGWSVAIFDEEPWDICCDTGCEEPIFSESGTACPIEFTTDCLEPLANGLPYYAILSLEDNVGNETNIAYEIKFNDSCEWVTGAPVYPANCDYDTPEECGLNTDEDAYIIYVDPDGTMDDDCLCN